MANLPNPLDAPLQTSLHRIVLWAVFFVLIFGIVAVVGVLWWQWAVLVAVVWLVGFLEWQTPTLGHLVQLPAKQGDDNRWQLLVNKNGNEQLWQGRLVAVKEMGVGLWLHFEIDEPMMTEFKATVFFDQLDDDDKRKLKMAVRFF